VEEAATVLPVGPWALAAVATVLVVALSVPPGGPRPADVGATPAALHRRWPALLAAAAVVALLVLARTGPDSPLRNPVPALVVGLGWPLLLLVPALVGLVRPVTGRADSPVVWPAALPALALGAALTLPLNPAEPVAVSTALAAYALVVLAAAVALGRATVAARFELLGLLAAWLAVGRRLPRWAAPPGALVVLAVLLGGAWFGTSGRPRGPATCRAGPLRRSAWAPPSHWRWRSPRRCTRRPAGAARPGPRRQSCCR
jgi:hypothetical protein